MTDNEIIKTAENCCSAIPNCLDCQLDGDAITCDKCMGQLLEMCLDLLNRQKAEIEEKDIEIDILIKKKDAAYDECSELKERNDELNILNKIASQEAIKDFVERVKQEINFPLAVWKVFDNLVKEMTGGD